MAQDNVDVIESAYAAFRKGDIEAVIEVFSESAEIIAPASVPWGGEYEGPEGMRTLIAKLFEHFADYKMTPQKVLGADDNHVIVIARTSGRTKSGTRYEGESVWIYQLREGAVTSAHAFADTAEVLEALG